MAPTSPEREPVCGRPVPDVRRRTWVALYLDFPRRSDPP